MLAEHHVMVAATINAQGIQPQEASQIARVT